MYNRDLLQDTASIKAVPKSDISTIYDRDDNVLFGSNVTKGKVSYQYIDASKSVDGKHIYLNSQCHYDGKGNIDLPEDAIIMSFKDILKIFE